MDSTGVHGRVQTTEACVQVLEERYNFEKRGTVFVKGKNDMNVYLLCEKKKTGLS
jgi:adenylate cyclase 9